MKTSTMKKKHIDFEPSKVSVSNLDSTILGLESKMSKYFKSLSLIVFEILTVKKRQGRAGPINFKSHIRLVSLRFASLNVPILWW